MLAAIALALTIFVHLQGRGMESLASRPVGARISNALVAYARYLGKTFWPVDLTNPYPLTSHWPWGQMLAAGALVLDCPFGRFCRRGSGRMVWWDGCGFWER